MGATSSSNPLPYPHTLYSRTHLAISKDILEEKRDTTGSQWVEVRETAKPPTISRMFSHNKMLIELRTVFLTDILICYINLDNWRQFSIMKRNVIKQLFQTQELCPRDALERYLGWDLGTLNAMTVHNPNNVKIILNHESFNPNPFNGKTHK